MHVCVYLSVGMSQGVSGRQRTTLRSTHALLTMCFRPETQVIRLRWQSLLPTKTSHSPAYDFQK